MCNYKDGSIPSDYGSVQDQEWDISSLRLFAIRSINTYDLKSTNSDEENFDVTILEAQNGGKQGLLTLN